MNEAWEEEQMSNLGCETVSDLIAEVKRLREKVKTEKNLKLWEKAEVERLQEDVKQLREMLFIAEVNIPRRIHWDCYVNALIEAGFEEGEEE